MTHPAIINVNARSLTRDCPTGPTTYSAAQIAPYIPMLWNQGLKPLARRHLTANYYRY